MDYGKQKLLYKITLFRELFNTVLFLHFVNCIKERMKTADSIQCSSPRLVDCIILFMVYEFFLHTAERVYKCLQKRSYYYTNPAWDLQKAVHLKKES